jgi:hypothetical protein
MTTSITDECEHAAHQSWTQRRTLPAYVLGRPTWVWQAALCRRKTRRLATVAG